MDQREEENIVIFPFLAQGHIIPFLALALEIERRKNYKVTFVNTPLNVKRLRSYLPATSSIRLIELPFNSSDHGLQPDTENTDALPYPLIINLIQAATFLESAFRTLLEGLIEEHNGKRPLCVIADIFYGWAVGLSQQLGIFHVIFSVSCGYGLACYCSSWSSLPHRSKDPEGFFQLEDFKEASKLHVTQLPFNILEADGTDNWSVFQNKNLPEWVNADGMLFNTLEEIDQVGLMYFRRKLGLPVWAIGPIMLSNENRAQSGKQAGISPDFYKKWLDGKAVNSVMYVSFGSNNTISPSQMMQLAMALEASGRNFIWVVRPPVGFDINSEFKAEEWLPQGFDERMKNSGRGLLVNKWAPQVEILSHKSTGAFFTQCGWNSVLEALSYGVPLLGWGMAAEQFFTVKLLEEEMGVCVEVARGKSCEVRHEDIKAKIELVMSETEKSKEIRRRACVVKEFIRDAMRDEDDYKGSSATKLDAFFGAAISMREKKAESVEAAN